MDEGEVRGGWQKGVLEPENPGEWPGDQKSQEEGALGCLASLPL